jgi:putative tryptophan/tyrosine transport system substrate-binding protein
MLSANRWWQMRFSHLRRRDLIWLLGWAACRPLAARAQQIGKVSRIAFLGTSSPSLERHLVDAFRQKLRELGHVDGENIAIEYRWAEGQDDRFPSLAAELVRLKPDVIVTMGTPGTLAAKQATNTIPIVFASSGDPVGAGFVASIARPGGNVTGFTNMAELEGKRLEILKDAVPGLSRVAVLWNSANPVVMDFYQQTLAAATALGVTLQTVVEVRRVDDFKDAFSTIANARPDAMMVLVDRLLLAHRMQIVNFAATSRLPVMYPYRAYVDAGGLMSYAPSDIDLFRNTAIYVDKILKGTNPADLPVQEPTKFEFVINLKTGKAIGLDLSPTLLARADEVIE